MLATALDMNTGTCPSTLEPIDTVTCRHCPYLNRMMHPEAQVLCSLYNAQLPVRERQFVY